jgi:CDP-diacylglycerol--inositol 3-phosphatidyltransferase
MGISEQKPGLSPADHKRQEFRRILLFLPNVIGYVRIFFLASAYFFFWSHPGIFGILYTLSVSLDFFDGIIARKFNQCSSFGAWLDVIVDNLSRGLLWANLFQWGWLVVSLEWITFVGNHSAGRAKWQKEVDKGLSNSEQPPKFVQMIMANGFKTPTGTLTILGLHCLPMWIYAMQTDLLSPYLPYAISFIICLILVAGRLLCAACELWCVQKHIKSLLLDDVRPECENQNGDFPDQNKLGGKECKNYTD